MAKIPFDIKYRPQIESGEYKVETRDGKKVRVLCYDANNIVPVVALVTFCDGNELSRDYYSNGTIDYDRENPLDLFIVTPEEELTEFEIRLLDWLSDDTSGEIPMERMKEVVRNRAAELHSLARKEFENEAPSIIEAQSFKAGFKAGKAEAMKDLEETGKVHCKSYDKGYDNGKEEALRDMPKWKRIRKGERLPETSNIWDFAYGERNGGGISTNWLLPNIPCVVGCDAWYIPVDVIKNLPREEEDNHE